jgi:hypothetical protein
MKVSAVREREGERERGKNLWVHEGPLIKEDSHVLIRLFIYIYICV